MSFISAVPENKRPALFQSLLFEACGRTVDPVNGAVGLLSAGNWHICQAAVETVLAGGALRPLSVGILRPLEESEAFACKPKADIMHGSIGVFVGKSRNPVVGSLENTASFGSGLSEVSPGNMVKEVGSKKPKLLNLFA
ncbi:hypothetical protein DH2020_035443 [Rehmannia glutinosa]|uniref:LOB domain-containing protein n=1 Tax=Rehmannia glutinosa TaxID=99300 RepID=A0ABR0V6N7_REHGL